MGFFGTLVDTNEFEMDIPDTYSLQFLNVCLDLEDPGTDEATTSLFVQTAHEEHGYILCHLRKDGCTTVQLSHTFGPEDSPISLWTNNGKVHLTGNWTWEVSDCEIDDDECDDNSECVECDQEEDHSVVNKRKHTHSSSNTGTSNSNISVATRSEVIDEIKEKAKKMRKEKIVAALIPEDLPPVVVTAGLDMESKVTRKKWNVKPQNDEGVLVPNPKQLKKSSGILITDYVIGNGIEPKLGSKVQITYEGCFPDGKIFDANLKRKKPLVFRKGMAEVVRGLDLGLEGVRIGGSREIVIPPDLGYGREGLGIIPGNQILVFRVTLVGQGKKS